jgi:hypothetical protein
MSFGQQAFFTMDHAHDTDDLVSDMDDDQSAAGDHRDIEEVISPGQGDLIDRAVKISSDEEEKSDPSPTLLDSSRGGSMPTTGQAADSASIHSLPTVHVTEPQSPPQRPSTARYPESSTPLSTCTPSSPTRSHRSHRSAAETSLTPTERRVQHRSAVEVWLHRF